ncbi:MAG: heavy-metal-associated domain-containing protein [Planctomycetes bacterium]|nr:heavy-metal-associated domain-containing protein [Planctomycetota bacterium]
MKAHSILLAVALLAIGAIAYAQDRGQQPANGAATTKATYLVTGLHCPPCTRTVESSLSRISGIRSIKVDWQKKSAAVEFDESVLPAQRVAQLIAGTPHMMGGNMKYAGWLALRIPELRDDATARAAKDALSKLPGVTRVAAYPAQHSLSVEFGAQGAVTSRQLIDALAAAGLKAETF